METGKSELLAQINSYDLTPPGSNISFEEKLAADNLWTHGFAMLVTKEYRRFIYLTQIDAQMICPSDEVDQAWHLHITQTASYEAFCRNLLRGFLHHQASRGGQSELLRHKEMYSFTLSKYKEVFGTTADPEIWPSVEERFTTIPITHSHTESTLNRSFLFKNVGLVFAVIALTGVFTSQLAGDVLWPSISGREFMVFFTTTLVFASWIPTVFGKVACISLRQKALDPYEVAYMQDGADRVLGTAIARLVDLGALTLKAVRKAGSKDIQGAMCELNPNFDKAACNGMHPIEYKLLTAWPEDSSNSQASVAIEPLASDIHRRLVNAGNAMEFGKINRLRGITILILLCLVLIGANRYWYGIQSQQPVFFLGSWILVSYLIISHHSRKEIGATKLGSAVLKVLQDEYLNLKTKAGDIGIRRQLNSSGTGTLLAFGFALFGSQAVMTAEDFAGINWVIGSRSNTGNSNGSGGCGGGGCGGGCGGCGG